MKKSQIYKAAQIAVLAYTAMNATAKIEVLRELFTAEDLALFSEKLEAEELLRDTESEDDETV